MIIDLSPLAYGFDLGKNIYTEWRVYTTIFSLSYITLWMKQLGAIFVKEIVLGTLGLDGKYANKSSCTCQSFFGDLHNLNIEPSNKGCFV